MRDTVHSREEVRAAMLAFDPDPRDVEGGIRGWRQRERLGHSLDWRGDVAVYAYWSIGGCTPDCVVFDLASEDHARLFPDPLEAIRYATELANRGT